MERSSDLGALDSRVSPLELLLPDGRAGRSLVLGGSCPPALVPHSRGDGEGAPVQLIVLAPSAAEAEDVRWLDDAVNRVEELDPDGVVYVLASPRARRRLRALLATRGLTQSAGFLHVPSLVATRFLLPLEKGAFRYAFAHLVPVKAHNRARTSVATWLPTLAPITALASPVGVAARRPRARSLFDWLFADRPDEVGTAIVGGLGKEGGRPVLHRFARGAGTPSAVAKVAPPAKATALAAVLRELGPAATSAGAEVPEPLPVTTLRGAILESFVPGTNASLVLARDADSLPEVLEEVVGWLERWTRATARPIPLTRESLQDWVLAPLARLEGQLVEGARYRQDLESLGRELMGRTVPCVAVHADLTMSNVLFRRGAAIGVVDWDGSCGTGLPLVDFFYAVADATAATKAYRSRPAAARECFAGQGLHTRRVEEWRRRLTHSLGVSETLSALCFHACWLHHAGNEQRASSPGDPRPFLEILDWASSSTELLPGASIS